MLSHLRNLALVLTGLLAVRNGCGQCPNQWISGGPHAASDGEILTSVEWDPDGAGPQSPVLVLAGAFQVAGSTTANNIATFDPATGLWAPLAEGIEGSSFYGPEVRALAVLQSGELLAGGRFDTAGSGAAVAVAVWDGLAWQPLGSALGINGSVDSLLVLANGDVVAAGDFSIAGGSGNPMGGNLARWNGSSWTALVPGLVGYVRAMVATPGGELVVGGNFAQIGGVQARQLASWDGVSWSEFQGGIDGRVKALAVAPAGGLLVGGRWLGTGAAGVRHWDGGAWLEPPEFAGADVLHLQQLPGGDVMALGEEFASFGEAAARFDGTSWVGVGAATPGEIRTVTELSTGELVVAGGFSSLGGAVANQAAVKSSGAWGQLGVAGANSDVVAVSTLANGDLVVGGYFSSIGGVVANRVAVRSASGAWSPLGAGLDILVSALAQMPNGDIIAGGVFSSSGGVALNNIARWDGANWSPMGSGSAGYVYSLLVRANGDLLASGFFVIGGVTYAVARWDGTNWQPFGEFLRNSPPSSLGVVWDLIELTDGSVVAAGTFHSVDGVPADYIARWDGSSWSSYGTGLADVARAVVELPGGDIVAGGDWSPSGSGGSNGVERWDGQQWTPFDTGIYQTLAIWDLAKLPNGDLLLGGSFRTGPNDRTRAYRWDGFQWLSIGESIAMLDISEAVVRAFAAMPNGDVVLGGRFTIVDDQASAHMAILSTTCPATATPFGSGCAGSVGLNALATTMLPWTGSRFEAQATGMPTASLAVGVYGLTSGSTPLGSLLPQALSGCDLLVSADVLQILLPNNGSATSSLALPNTVNLAGAVLHHQVVAFETGPLGDIVAVTSTNGLTATVGSF